MYIWILLASIMVALTFFNLSPRSDKDGYISEAKAASVVSRFRIEHVAAMQATECDLIMKRNPSSSQNIMEIEYEGLQGFLPIGYQRVASFDPKHEIYCLAGKIESSPELSVNCAVSSYRYLISYVKIPDKWITKAGDEISPLPALTNFVAKSYVSGGMFGWTICDAENGCSLHHSRSDWDNVNNQNIDDDKFGVMMGDPTKRQGFVSGLMAEGGKFATECYGNACLFSYNKYNVKDTGGHCSEQ